MTLKEAEQILRGAGIDGARGEARKILSAIGKFPDYELFSPNLSTESEDVISAVKRRATREPLQYILGEVSFYRERYKVTPEALIPREDTELLVDFAVKRIPRGARFLDLCTGSGCIALSVLNNTEKTFATAVDISAGALNLAKENAARLGLSDRIDFVLGDALSEAADGDFFAVLSNPPYVTREDYSHLQKEIYFEPMEAFVGGEDGGIFYRRITELYKDKISSDGFIAYEIGYGQRELLEKVARDNLMDVEITKDLSGNDRVAVLRRK